MEGDCNNNNVFEEEVVMGTQPNELESQTQSQIELTQLFEETAESQSTVQTPISSPFTPVNQRTIPWGRLIRLADNDHNHQFTGDQTKNKNNLFSSAIKVGIELLPRDPLRSSSVTTRSKSLSSSSPSQDDHHNDINFMGIKNLNPSDRFNEYVLGRSAKCDIVAAKQRQLLLNGDANKGTDGKHSNVDSNQNQNQNQNNWVHSMISNKHCRIFCILKNQSSKRPAPRTPVNNFSDLEVYIEDTSGNGTMINQSTLLHRGERRLLHTGDEICLINPVTLQRKIRSIQTQKEILSHYSFLFINLLHTQRQIFTQQNHHPNFRNIITSHNIATVDSECSVPTKKGRKKDIVDKYAKNKHTSLHQPFGGVGRLPFQGKKENKDMPPPYCQSSSSKVSGTFDQNQSRRIEEYYDLRDLLGSGTCGEVRRAINRKSGIQVAVKIIPIDERNQSQKALWGKYSQIHAEASILKSLNHPYIVQLLDVFCHPGKAIYLVMELLSGGDLFDRIVEKGRYSEIESRRIMRRIFAAVFYLHEDCDIVHRDLKPENILCVSHMDDIMIKLSDFGLAKSVTEDGLKTFCGTPQYFAPEVLKRQNTIAGRGRYGKEADMWSLGVILYILLCGNPPFQISENINVIAEAKISFRGSKWENISIEAVDLIQKLLIIDPEKRIDINSACNHKWILMDDGDTHRIPLNDPILIQHQERLIETKETCNNAIEEISSPDLSRRIEKYRTKTITINENPSIGSKKLAQSSTSKSPKLELNIRRSNDVLVFSTPSQQKTTLNSPSSQKRPLNSDQRISKQQKVNNQKDKLCSPNKKDLTNNGTTESMTKISHLKASKQSLKFLSPFSPDESPRFPTPRREDQTPKNTSTCSNKESLFSTVKQLSVDGFASYDENRKHDNDNITQPNLSSPLSSAIDQQNKLLDNAAKNSPRPNKLINALSSSTGEKINNITIDFEKEIPQKFTSAKETIKIKFRTELSDDEIKSDFSDEHVTNDSIKSFSLDSQDEKKSVEPSKKGNQSSINLFQHIRSSANDSFTHKNNINTSNETELKPKSLENMKLNLNFDANDETSYTSKKDVIKDNICSYLDDKNEVRTDIDDNIDKVVVGKGKLSHKKRGPKPADLRDNIKKNLKTAATETSTISKGKQTTLSNWFKKK